MTLEQWLIFVVVWTLAGAALAVSEAQPQRP